MSHGSPLALTYEKLESLVTTKKWKEADLETNNLLQKIETVENRKRDREPKFVALEDIKIIDRLWIQASNGHFGFSVRAEIYQSWGGDADFSKTDKAVWVDFCKELGWFDQESTSIFGRSNRKFNTALDDHQFNYSLPAPRGHIPSFTRKSSNWNLNEILERLLDLFHNS